MRSLKLSRAATSDLSDISGYSVATFGYAVAIAYMHSLDEMMDRLLDFPELGAAVYEIAPRLRYMPCNSHRIFYEIDVDAITIVRVLHKAMDVQKALS